MPNWCSNCIDIYVPPTDEGRRIVGEIEKLIDVPEPFLAIYPPPPGTDDDTPAAYDWRVAEWGTKWDAEGSYATGHQVHLTWTCDTAWSPPVGVLRKLSERFPSAAIVLAWEELGMGSTGCAVFHAGGVALAEDRDTTTDDCEEIQDDDGDYVNNPDFVALSDRFPQADKVAVQLAATPLPSEPAPAPPRAYPPEDTDEARAERRRAARAALTDSTNGGAP